MIERWKMIEGFGNKYKISDAGNVVSIYGKKVSINLNKGYSQVVLLENGKQKCLRVHQLVAKSFIPNPENKKTVNHKNGIKTDNRAENLEWATFHENKSHATSNGFVARNENHGMAKLKNDSIPIIKNRLSNGETCQNIANDYEVHKTTISRIGSNKMWKHL